MAKHQPKPPAVPLALWQDLLTAAVEFRTVKPWTWMVDQDVFALIDHDNRPWFPSVLGAGGQVFGLALYQGETGLRFLLETVHTLEDSPHSAMFEQNALLLDWGAKQALAPEELAVLSALGHQPKTRERNAWPCYRSHSPGLFPWHLDETEARSLAAGIRATLACAELARARPDFFAPSDGDDTVLPTVSLATALAGRLSPDQVEWRQWLLPPPPNPAAAVAPDSWSELAKRPKQSSLVLEFDVFHAMMPTSNGGRPYFPRIGLMADGKSGFIYGMDLAGPDRAWADLVTSLWGKTLAGLRERPGAIAIRRPEWADALRPLTEKLGVRLLVVEELPFIDEARDSMMQHLGG